MNVQLGDYGTRFSVTFKDQDNVVFPLSGLTVQFRFCKPDGTILTVSPTVATYDTDGEAYYVTQSGQINVKGIWRLQGDIDGAGKKYRTEITSFRVVSNVDAE